MKFTVDDFKTGYNFDTPAKKHVYHQLAQNNGGWECSMKAYELNGGKISAKGLTKSVRMCLDLKSKMICAEARYQGDPEGPINYLVHMLAPQWVRKFPEIYALHTGKSVYGCSQIEQLGMYQIDRALNTKSTPIKPNLRSLVEGHIKSKSTTPDMLRAAADIQEKLEDYNEKEKEAILALVF